jgi:hypothetical protein
VLAVALEREPEPLADDVPSATPPVAEGATPVAVKH